MSGKKRAKKGIESLTYQIELHREKLRKAVEEGNIGLAKYYEKEIQHFEQARKKMERRIKPKLKRKKETIF